MLKFSDVLGLEKLSLLSLHHHETFVSLAAALPSQFSHFTLDDLDLATVKNELKR